jgi:hypothetical protein
MLGADLAPSGRYADQNHALQAQLAVLDFSDVGQLGRHPSDAAEREPIFEVGLVSVIACCDCRPWLEALNQQFVVCGGGKLWVSSRNCHLRTRISR